MRRDTGLRGVLLAERSEKAEDIEDEDIGDEGDEQFSFHELTTPGAYW